MAVRDTRGARRRQTATSIELAALRQAVEKGSASVTVESICSDALISPRTFYNYFHSRDAVLAGQEWSTITSEMAERFAADDSGDLLSRLVRLFIEASPKSPLEHEIADLRRRLFEREPQWTEHAMAGFTRCVDHIAELVLTEFEEGGRTIESESDLFEVAQMTVMVTGSVLHASLLDRRSSADPAAESERLTRLARRAIGSLIS